MSKEYIERKALLQDIVETVVFSTKTGERNLEIEGAKKVIGRIQAVPTADVVEVVRCKDCRFWEGQKDIAQGLCLMRSAYPTGYWYCAYGIRKEDGNND